MIDKNNGNAPISNAIKPSQKHEVDVANFKLLYRNMPNPERHKSSGVSSDDETTSSSLIPIPNTLRQMRNKLKRTTVSDAEHSDSAYNVSEILETPIGIVRNSLERIRKKYTLESETSVALKMNSAHLILDDILNTANLNITSDDNLQPRFFKQHEKSKTLSENETSTTGSSVSVTKHYPHIIDHSHSIAYDYFPPSCPRHGPFGESLQKPVEKEKYTPPKNQECTQKKTIIEKIHDLQIKGRIQSVCRSFQRTKNPFRRGRKEPKIMKLQGIPSAGYHENKAETPKCDNCPIRHDLKRLNLDLVETSELSQSEWKSTDWEAQNCMCLSQRECNCPEVIPKCNCVAMSFEITSRNLKHSSHKTDDPNINNMEVLGAQSNAIVPQEKEDRSRMLLQKEDEIKEEKNKKKTNSLSEHLHGNKKYCSQERRITERTDIYYFDHGNSAYYQTTDHHPLRYTECLVERTDHYATKFWAEFFGTIEIGAAFLISFLLQFYRFLFTSIIRSLTVGLLQIFSDYFFKPFLTIIFNGIIQPCLILAYNIATSVRDLCLPVSQTFGFFAKEFAVIFMSCRLVEVNREKQPSCHCGNKV